MKNEIHRMAESLILQSRAGEGKNDVMIYLGSGQCGEGEREESIDEEKGI